MSTYFTRNGDMVFSFGDADGKLLVKKNGVDKGEVLYADQIATINGQSITNGGNIEVAASGGGTGEQGPQGEKGDKGDPFVYEDFTDEQLALLVGPQGPKGDTGAQGEKGADGTGVNIKGSLTLEQLNALTPADVELNDAYLVSGDLYVCTDPTVPTFQNAGSIQGPKGDKGDTGNGIVEITKTGTVDNIDTYTIYFTDNTTTEFSVTNGTVGEVTVTLASDEVYQQGLAADEAPSVKQVKTDINKINTDITNLTDKLTDGFIDIQVPILYSNGTPYTDDYAVSASSEFSDKFAAWKAANQTAVDSDDCWSGDETETEHAYYLYFNTQVVLNKIVFHNRQSGVLLAPSTIIVYGNKINAVGDEVWELISEHVNSVTGVDQSWYIEVKNDEQYYSYKLAFDKRVNMAMINPSGRKSALISEELTNILVETLTNEKVITEEKLNTVLGGYISTLSDSDIQLISERMVSLKLPSKVEW